MTLPDPELADAIKAAIDGDAFALEIAKRLMHEGREVNGIQDDTTLLLTAIAFDKLEITKLLLIAGARFEIIKKSFNLGFDKRRGKIIEGSYEISATENCQSSEMAALLGRYNQFDPELFSFATGAALIPDQQIETETFNQFSAREFGRRNPEPCRNPFYLDQIRTGRSAYAAGMAFRKKNTKGSDKPIWSFQRFGRSVTPLPDGRLVLIAGEHEDGYDPDFTIYNDVTVLDRKGGVQHFLYPKAIFPPTDFHTATLLKDHILLIGSLGYTKQRHEGKTQVLRLNLRDFSVEPVITHGDNPGWICRHDAEHVGDDIFVAGGKVDPGYSDLKGSFALNLPTMVWRRIS